MTSPPDIKDSHSVLSLSGQSLIFGAGALGRQAAIYLALPLFTHTLSREDYGIISVTASLLAFLGILINSGLTPAVFRLYNDTLDEKIRRQTLGGSQTLILSLVCSLVFLVNVLAQPISVLLTGALSYAPVVRIVSVLAGIESLTAYGQVLLRIQVRPLASSIQILMQIAFQLGLALVFVVGLNLGVAGYWSGYLVGAIVGLMLVVWMARKLLVFQAPLMRIKELAVYALPLAPSLLALWALQLIDRWLVTSFLGLTQAAVYDVGYKLGLLGGLIIPPFTVAWPQFALSAMHKSNAPSIYRRVLNAVMLGTLFTTTIIISFGQDLTLLLTPSGYVDAVKIIPWISFSQVGWGAYQIAHASLHITKRVWHLAAINMTSALLNIVLNLVLIPTLGITGAAVATFVAYAVMALLTYLVGRRFYPIPLDWQSLLKMGIACLITLMVEWGISQLTLPWLISFLVRGLGLLCFPIALLALGIISRDQLSDLSNKGVDGVRRFLMRVLQTEGM